MITAADFRRMALSFPEATESSHMDHPDFRVGGKIFATLGPGEKWGVLMLSPDEQKEFVAKTPGSFSPVEGGWGRRGCTHVHLEEVDSTLLRQAMTLAWRKRAPRRLLAKTASKIIRK